LDCDLVLLLLLLFIYLFIGIAIMEVYGFKSFKKDILSQLLLPVCL